VQRGGSLNDIGELVTVDGPGMQLPPLILPNSEKAWFHYPFNLDNTVEDCQFYTSPRMVHHLDRTAREEVCKFHSRILSPGTVILDLMSSHESHLAPEFNESKVTGLGLNKAELAANEMLSERLIHDLNMYSRLPFDDNSFDAVICTVSIEYLTQPYEIMEQIARVLKPGGHCAITVSDRWFPGKQISPWQHLHPFERQGMLLGFFLRKGLFENLQTESVRGKPRPTDDKHFPTTQLSDPLFFIWGTTK
jgi:SAM-dependent methyltransferase